MKLLAVVTGVVGGLSLSPTLSAAEVVQMSPYEVEAQSVEFRGWKKFRSPNFIVYSDARAREIRPYIRQMEKMYLVNQVIFGRVPLKHEPVRVILPTARSDWRELRSKGGVEWEVAVSGWDAFSYTCLVEYDWQDDGLYAMWGSLASMLGNAVGVNWAFPMHKGVASYFETMRSIESGVKVGTISPRVLPLRRLGLLDWERFFSLRSSSREFTRKGNDLTRIGGQSALFTHYVLMSGEPDAVDKILTWNAQLEAGSEPTSEAFAAIFGLTYEELQEVMVEYLQRDEFTLFNYAIPDEVMDFVVTELDVRVTEMRELFVLIQILNQRIDESEVALDTLLERGLESPALMPLLVEASIGWRRGEEVAELLRQMIADGDDAAETHASFLGATFISEFGLPLAHQRITPANYERYRLLADAALQREPMHSGSNLVLAWMLALKEEIDVEDIAELREICRRMDGNGETDDPLAALALALRRTGDTATAERLIAHVEASPFTDSRVRRFIESYRKEFGGN